MATSLLENIGSGTGLLSDYIKPLPDPMSTYCKATLGNTLQRTYPENTNIFVKEISFEHVCKLVTILLPPEYVN